MKDKVEISKKLLFKLAHSHSELLQNVYNNVSSMNDSHPAMIVENEFIKFLREDGKLWDEFFSD